jgi:hypothetical protein
VPVFIPYDLRALHDTYASLQASLDGLANAYASYPYKTPAGAQYAHQGFLRRFSLMHHCVERVFELIPPELDEKPPDPVLYDATAFIQSFVMNAFGGLDNLAWLWASEKHLKLNRSKIGLGPKCKEVRASFSDDVRHFLTAHDDWFDDLIDFRDALAHRISLYIPPWVVSLHDEEAHKTLEAQKQKTNDTEEFDRLITEQRKLERFHPIMKHALDDNKPPVPFHFRIVNDFRTVEMIAEKVLVELKRASR